MEWINPRFTLRICSNLNEREFDEFCNLRIIFQFQIEISPLFLKKRHSLSL